MLESLTVLLKYFLDERHRKSDKRDVALLAINKAVQETWKDNTITVKNSFENQIGSGKAFMARSQEGLKT